MKIIEREYHETKKEWFKRQRFIIKFLYSTGSFKLIPKEYGFMTSDGYMYRYGMRARRLHPVTWITCLFVLIFGGFNKETFKEIKKDTCWW